MSQIQKRGIAANAIDETKILLNNNAWLAALNNSSASANLLRLNASNYPEFASPVVVPNATLSTHAINQSQLTSALSSYILSSLIGAANGVAPLNSSGKLPSSYLPSGIAGGLNFAGVIPASGSLPSSPTVGQFYVISTAGTFTGTTYALNVNDWIVYDGNSSGDLATGWDVINNQSLVQSVNGQMGAVVLTTSNISEGSNLYYTSARFIAAFASETTSSLSEGSNLYFTNARAIAAPLTGYSAAVGTVSSSDSILTAIQKVDANSQAKASSFTRFKETLTISSTDISNGYKAASHAPLSNSMILVAFGVPQLEGTDYSISGSTITFISSGSLNQLVNGDTINLQYSY